MDKASTHESSEDQLPQEVVAALREREAPKTTVPESLDTAILAYANQHLSSIHRPTPAKSGARKWRWVAWSTGTLAAAMLLLAIIPSTPDAARQADTVAMSTSESGFDMADIAPLPQDIDGNGQVNILDAFVMARGLETGDIDGVRWDQNGDGAMNQQDINLVALHAVML